MKKLLTTIFLVALFAILVTGQTKKEEIYEVGRDKDGDLWHLDLSLVVRPRPPADWLLVMPIYTTDGSRTLVFMYNVDCSDNTYQIVKGFSMNRRGETIWESQRRGDWSKFQGYSGNAGRILCSKKRQIPVNNSPITE